MHEAELAEDFDVNFRRRRLEKRSEIGFGPDAPLLYERERIRKCSGRHIVATDDRDRVELAEGLVQRRRLLWRFFGNRVSAFERAGFRRSLLRRLFRLDREVCAKPVDDAAFEGCGAIALTD